MIQCSSGGGVRGHRDRKRGEGEAYRRVAARHKHACGVARAARRAKVEVEAIVAGEVEASGDGPRQLVEESKLRTAYMACIVKEGLACIGASRQQCKRWRRRARAKPLFSCTARAAAPCLAFCARGRRYWGGGGGRCYGSGGRCWSAPGAGRR